MAYRTRSQQPATSIEAYKTMEWREIRIKVNYDKPNRSEIEKNEINRIEW